MRFFAAVFAAIAIAAPAFASPAPLRAIEKFDGKTTGRFIVKLKDGASKPTLIKQLKADAITHDWKLLNGFAGTLVNNLQNVSLE
jgi:cerevisin